MATIKLTNGVLLDESSIKGLKGIDFDNVLATFTANTKVNYDGFAIQSNIGNAINIGIDGHSMLQYSKSGATDYGSSWVLVKAGQTVNTGGRSTTLYGIK